MLFYLLPQLRGLCVIFVTKCVWSHSFVGSLTDNRILWDAVDLWIFSSSNSVAETLVG